MDVNNSILFYFVVVNGDIDVVVFLLEREVKVDVKDKVFWM